MKGAVRIRRSIGTLLFLFYPPEVLQKLADDWADDRRWLTGWGDLRRRDCERGGRDATRAGTAMSLPDCG